MEQADNDKVDRKAGSAPGFLQHVEASGLKDLAEKAAPEFQQAEMLETGGVGEETRARGETPKKASATPVAPEKVSVTPVTPEKASVAPAAPKKASVTPVTPEKAPVVPVTPEKASVTPVVLAGGIVTRLTPPPLLSGDLLVDPEALTARQKSRLAREKAEPLLGARYIALMLAVGIAVGAVIGTLAAMSLFP